MNIYIFNGQKGLSIPKPKVKKIVKAVVSYEAKNYDEVAIHFISTEEICKLHEQFFQDPSPTDCISFPMDLDDQDGYRVLGEVFICPQTAIDYATKHRTNPHAETTLYIVHGLLHLMGYDDIDKKDRTKMRSAEKRHMRHLQELNLVL